MSSGNIMVPTISRPGMGEREAPYTGFAKSQLAILRRQMELGGLKIGERRIRLDDGAEVLCSINYNYESVSIKVLAPALTEQLARLEKDCIFYAEIVLGDSYSSDTFTIYSVHAVPDDYIGIPYSRGKWCYADFENALINIIPAGMLYFVKFTYNHKTKNIIAELMADYSEIQKGNRDMCRCLCYGGTMHYQYGQFRYHVYHPLFGDTLPSTNAYVVYNYEKYDTPGGVYGAGGYKMLVVATETKLYRMVLTNGVATFVELTGPILNGCPVFFSRNKMEAVYVDISTFEVCTISYNDESYSVNRVSTYSDIITNSTYNTHTIKYAIAADYYNGEINIAYIQIEQFVGLLPTTSVSISVIIDYFVALATTAGYTTGGKVLEIKFISRNINCVLYSRTYYSHYGATSVHTNWDSSAGDWTPAEWCDWDWFYGTRPTVTNTYDTVYTHTLIENLRLDNDSTTLTTVTVTGYTSTSTAYSGEDGGPTGTIVTEYLNINGTRSISVTDPLGGSEYFSGGYSSNTVTRAGSVISYTPPVYPVFMEETQGPYYLTMQTLFGMGIHDSANILTPSMVDGLTCSMSPPWGLAQYFCTVFNKRVIFSDVGLILVSHVLNGTKTATCSLDSSIVEKVAELLNTTYETNFSAADIHLIFHNACYDVKITT
jgi:hypothetical protein